MIAVRWTNDDLDEAPTWQALLDDFRAAQWHVYTEQEFREQMAFRALNWSGTRIDPTGTPDEFFAELERAGLIVIEQSEEEDRPGC